MAETGAKSRIFISYRRGETSDAAGWLFNRLVEHFGEGQVFKDTDAIAPGADVVETISDAVGSCDVLLALIGSEWLTITDDDGKRRIDNPGDFVRLEIEAALKRNLRVVPVLIGGARMPRAEELPASLAGLSRRHALELSSSHFEFETSRLLQVLDEPLGKDLPFVGREATNPPDEWEASDTAATATADPAASTPDQTEPPAEAPPLAVTAQGTLSHTFRQAALAGVVPATTPQDWFRSNTVAPETDLYVHHSAIEGESWKPLPGESSVLFPPRESPVPPHESSVPAPGSPVAAPESTGRWPWGLAVATVAITALGGLAIAKWVFGWLTLPIDDEATRLDDVQCTVFAPPAVSPGITILVQVFAHFPEEADDCARDRDGTRRRGTSPCVPQPRGASPSRRVDSISSCACPGSRSTTPSHR